MGVQAASQEDRAALALKLPQEAVVGSKKMGGGRGAGVGKSETPLINSSSIPRELSPSPSHFSESEN